MSDCVFCAVLRRETTGTFVYEDDETAAFLDIYPLNPGHTLVVPQRHFADLSDCPPDIAAGLFQVAARLAPAVMAAAGADGFNIWTANGAAAGQTVFHLHLHVLPRFREDSFGLRFPPDYPRAAEREDLETIGERIRSRA